MKNAARIVVMALLTVSVVRAAEPVKYGKGVTLKSTTSLDQVLKNPKSFEGKTVRVEGVVTAVCEMMGCWMALGTKDVAGTPTLMLKVEDGVIVFPVSAKGKRAAAEGVVERISAGDPEAKEAAQEKAHATGSAGAAPQVAVAAADDYLIKVTGAVVY